MAFIYDKDENNIVTLTIDMEGRSVNIINEIYYMSLLEIVKRLKEYANKMGLDHLGGDSIPSNKKTAIVGRSGSGKSTLTDIIACLIPPDKGDIIFGDISSKTY